MDCYCATKLIAAQLHEPHSQQYCNILNYFFKRKDKIYRYFCLIFCKIDIHIFFKVHIFSRRFDMG